MPERAEVEKNSEACSEAFDVEEARATPRPVEDAAQMERKRRKKGKGNPAVPSSELNASLPQPPSVAPQQYGLCEWV